MNNPTFQYSRRRYVTCFSVCLFLLSLYNIQLQAQTDTSYSFLVAGHAYGSHSGGNLGLHPALLNSLNNGYREDAAFIVFAGDIVNQSTEEAWTQVETELSSYPLESYYVMGNHDNTSAGIATFVAKHGNTFYTFAKQHSLFIILNSTLEQRSIPEDQVVFLADQLEGAADTVQNVFVFFHEVLWNSDEKYIDVRSNSRSRYAQMILYSNYWEDVHPLFTARPELNFYVITGDVGGNPDAIAAFYDTRDNVTLISTGMGEVSDENYLTVHLENEDSISFELVPLDDGITLHALKYYSVPGATGPITGPENITQGDTGVVYSVAPVFNAGSYTWELPDDTEGESLSENISVNFGSTFTEGTLSVKATLDGFGSGPASTLDVSAEISDLSGPVAESDIPEIRYVASSGQAILLIKTKTSGTARLSVFSSTGRMVISEALTTLTGTNRVNLAAENLPSGIYFVRLQNPDGVFSREIMVR